MHWEPHEGNQRRCREHEQVFPKTSTCSQCEPGKGSPLSAITPIDTDKELKLLGDDFRSSAKRLRRDGEELLEGTAMDKNTACKLYDTALKYDRAALEIIKARKDREHDRWLVEQNRLLQGPGAS